jgi:hypothetical protein
VVDLWALDEVHFHQYGSRGYLWVPPEVRDPILLHHPTRKSVAYFGAVRLRDGRLVVRRETEVFNGQTTWAFLQQLEQESRASDRQVVVIIDNAKFHHARLHRAWRLAQADHFRLDYLPPYSPDLNPIERVWKLTRKLCIHDVYFPTLESLILAVERQFAAWSDANEDLRRLCSIAE